MAHTITLRPKGQMTLPSEIREALNLDQGDQLVVSIVDDQIVLTRPEDVIKKTAGIFAKYAKDGPVKIDRDEIWGGIASEREERVLQQIAEESNSYDPD